MHEHSDIRPQFSGDRLHRIAQGVRVKVVHLRERLPQLRQPRPVLRHKVLLRRFSLVLHLVLEVETREAPR